MRRIRNFLWTEYWIEYQTKYEYPVVSNSNRILSSVDMSCWGRRHPVATDTNLCWSRQHHGHTHQSFSLLSDLTMKMTSYMYLLIPFNKSRYFENKIKIAKCSPGWKHTIIISTLNWCTQTTHTTRSVSDNNKNIIDTLNTCMTCQLITDAYQSLHNA